MSLIFQKQRPTTCRVDLHSIAAGFQRSDISHFTKRIKMIEGVKIITLEGTICDKDFHDAPRISRLLYCERSFSFSPISRTVSKQYMSVRILTSDSEMVDLRMFSGLQRSSHSLLFCKCADCQQNRLQI